MGLVSHLDAASKNSDGKMTDFLKDTASDTACVMKDNEVKFKYMSLSCYDEKTKHSVKLLHLTSNAQTVNMLY